MRTVPNPPHSITPEPEVRAGRVTELVKIVDTVRRPVTESSASVQHLLTHLEHAGFDGTPRCLGAQPDGSIVLSWIEGWVPADTECWRLGRGELASVGELLGNYHDCVAGFAPETGFEEGPQAIHAGAATPIQTRMSVRVLHATVHLRIRSRSSCNPATSGAGPDVCTE